MHELEWRRSNQLVRQTVGNNATSLDHTNENLMAWNKGSVSSSIFSKVCQRSACIMATKACVPECFEMNNWKSVAPSREKDVISLMKLLKAGDLYPKESTKKRVFDKDFWWGRICPSKEKAGSDKAKKRETVDQADHIQFVLDILTRTEEERDCDFDEELNVDNTQDDESRESGVISTLCSTNSVGDQPSNRPCDKDSEFPTEDWEMLEGEQRGTTIDQAMKSLRIKNTPMSAFITKDMLGEDADSSLEKVARAHVKRKLKDRRAINNIYRGVKYYQIKFKGRMDRLRCNLKNSKEGTYVKSNYSYRDEYDRLCANKSHALSRPNQD